MPGKCFENRGGEAMNRAKGHGLWPWIVGFKRFLYFSFNPDKVISSPIQEQMFNNLPCEKVIRMDTSHSPFFSAPDELVGHLLSLWSEEALTYEIITN
jgi:hypothetical protein